MGLTRSDHKRPPRTGVAFDGDAAQLAGTAGCADPSSRTAVSRPFMSNGRVQKTMSEIRSTDGVMAGQPRIEACRISVLQIDSMDDWRDRRERRVRGRLTVDR